MAESFILSEEQKEICRQYGTTEDVGAITRRCFGEVSTTGKRIDGRSPEARAVRMFLADVGITPKTVEMMELAPPYELTEEQKKQIESLAPKFQDGKTLELARLIWNDQTLGPLTKQARVVRAYYKEIYPEGINLSEEPVDEKEWKPPVTIQQLIGLVNQYIHQSDARKTYNLVTLKPTEKKCLESLMRYLRVYGLKYSVSEMTKQVDRELFLSTFIRWVHDKPDLTEIEVDQMILAAQETVNIASIARDIRRIEKTHEEIVSGSVTDDNGRRVRLTQADTEMINNIRTKHDASKKQLKDLMDRLETARSEREEERKDRYTSILDLLEPWQKDPDFRDRLLDAGIEEKEEDAKEVERLSGVEEIMAIISGQSKEEARS